MRRMPAKLGSLFRRRRMDADLAAEIAAHPEMEAEEQRAAGLSEAEARAAAHRVFGNAALALEDSRAMWGWAGAESLLRDLRLAGRSLARSPGFTSGAILTLALGIAASTVIFGFAYGVLWAPPPVRDPAGVMEVFCANPKIGASAPLSPADYAVLQHGVPAFSAMTAARWPRDVDLAVNGSPRETIGTEVEANYFHVLGVRPLLGRTFLAGGSQTGHGLILSQSLWETRFGGSRSALGRSVEINGVAYTVIGVMPARFILPAAPTDLWTRMDLRQEELAPKAASERSLWVFARRRPGTTVAQAQGEAAALGARLARQNPADHGWRETAMPLGELRATGVEPRPTLTLFGLIVAAVLLIACANVGGLLLARAGARRQELAIRAALGAGRVRLLRFLLAECVWLAAGGLALGLLLSVWGLGLLRAGLSSNPNTAGIPLHLDPAIWAFAAALSTLAVLLCGLWPAWHAARADPQRGLGSAGGGTPARAHGRRAMVAVEIGLAVFLLAAVGLLLQTMGAMFARSYGFNPRDLICVGATLPAATPSREVIGLRAAFVARATANLRAIPGVVSAAASDQLPATGAVGGGFSVGVPEPPARRGDAVQFTVSPGYLATMGIPLLLGRGFTAADRIGSPPVALVNAELARSSFPHRDPIGQTIVVYGAYAVSLSGNLTQRAHGRRRLRIVGVVGNVQDRFGQRTPVPQIYWPLLQQPQRELILEWRQRPGAAVPPGLIAGAIWAASSEKTIVGKVMGMDAVVKMRGAGAVQFFGEAMALFAALAAMLAAAGIYGVVAYLAGQRRQEIGIRIALGARRRDVTGMLLGEAAAFGGAGWLAGLAAACALPRLIPAVMEGISYSFPVSAALLSLAGLLIAAVALAASWVPARRAASADPNQALHWE
ncbi:MAG: ADOP family duplicated permease [Terriglobales bacterium]